MSSSFQSADRKNPNQRKYIEQTKEFQAMYQKGKSAFNNTDQLSEYMISSNGEICQTQDQTLQQIVCQAEEKHQSQKNQLDESFFNNSCNEQNQSFVSNKYGKGLLKQQSDKIYQQIQFQENSCPFHCFRSFLYINDTNYRPHIQSLKQMFSNLKDYSRRSLQDIRLILSFFQLKLSQQIQSIKLIDDQESLFESQQYILECVNIRETHLIKQNREKFKQKKKQFYKKIKENYERLLSAWIKVKQKREKRQKYLEGQIIKKIDFIECQISDTIKNRLQFQKERTNNPQTTTHVKQLFSKTKDTYLQVKYLMKSQNQYLTLISDFNAKMITYVLSMFSKEQMLLLKSSDEALNNYRAGQIQCYGPSNIDLMIQSYPSETVQQQLARLLISFIPRELMSVHQYKNSKIKLQDILLNYSSHLQNTIFLAVIQMNNLFIVFKSQAKWKIDKQFQEKKSKNHKNQSEIQAGQNSLSAKDLSSFNFSADQTVIVVLTCDEYLHIQHEDNIATIKLNNLQVKKKGRQVKLNFIKKGIRQIFGRKSKVVKLQFETNQEADIFIQKIDLAIRRLESF